MHGRLILIFVMVFGGLIACSGGGGSSAPVAPTPPVVDNAPPVITVTGAAGVIQQKGETYIDPGVSARDAVDGVVNVTVSDSVDTNVVGRYELIYSATDAAGNRATASRTVDVVGGDLYDFYTTSNPNRFVLPESWTNGVDTLIYAHDDLIAGDYAAAKAKVDAVFAAQPRSDSVWWTDWNSFGLNVGSPVGYYGLRMIEEIVNIGDIPTTNTLKMTAIVAKCGVVDRPTLPDLVSETVELDIDPRILEDDAKLLYDSTDLFRRWVKAITGGSEVQLGVQEIEECIRVQFNVRDDAISSYPDSLSMILATPEDVQRSTDFWWVVAPSGVPGDGSDFDRTFITGGMGLYANAPLFVSDDKWFTRKPAHLGQGDYSQVETRVYQPQWFQHEFMHHLYRTWPEYMLEVTGHQWFNRLTWPSDFIGEWEPDYYSESLNKRLYDASPSLAEGLDLPESMFLNFGDLPSGLVISGQYLRLPVQNNFHTIYLEAGSGTSGWQWRNEANVIWPLDDVDGQLKTRDDASYGAWPIFFLLNADGAIESLRYRGEIYIKQ